MYLYSLIQEGTGKKFLLLPRQNIFTIGRNPKCDIIFKSQYVSRQHCEITRIPPNGTLLIKNTSSTNNTVVDDITLYSDKQAELCVGAIIGLGVPLNLFEKYKYNSDFIYLRVIREEVPKIQERFCEGIISIKNEENYASSHTIEVNHDEIPVIVLDSDSHDEEIFNQSITKSHEEKNINLNKSHEEKNISLNKSREEKNISLNKCREEKNKSLNKIRDEKFFIKSSLKTEIKEEIEIEDVPFDQNLHKKKFNFNQIIEDLDSNIPSFKEFSNNNYENGSLDFNECNFPERRIVEDFNLMETGNNYNLIEQPLGGFESILAREVELKQIPEVHNHINYSVEDVKPAIGQLKEYLNETPSSSCNLSPVSMAPVSCISDHKPTGTVCGSLFYQVETLKTNLSNLNENCINPLVKEAKSSHLANQFYSNDVLNLEKTFSDDGINTHSEHIASSIAIVNSHLENNVSNSLKRKKGEEIGTEDITCKKFCNVFRDNKHKEIDNLESCLINEKTDQSSIYLNVQNFNSFDKYDNENYLQIDYNFDSQINKIKMNERKHLTNNSYNNFCISRGNMRLIKPCSVLLERLNINEEIYHYLKKYNQTFIDKQNTSTSCNQTSVDRLNSSSNQSYIDKLNTSTSCNQTNVNKQNTSTSCNQTNVDRFNTSTLSNQTYIDTPNTSTSCNQTYIDTPNTSTSCNQTNVYRSNSSILDKGKNAIVLQKENIHLIDNHRLNDVSCGNKPLDVNNLTNNVNEELPQSSLVTLNKENKSCKSKENKSCKSKENKYLKSKENKYLKSKENKYLKSKENKSHKPKENKSRKSKENKSHVSVNETDSQNTDCENIIKPSNINNNRIITSDSEDDMDSKNCEKALFELPDELVNTLDDHCNDEYLDEHPYGLLTNEKQYLDKKEVEFSSDCDNCPKSYDNADKNLQVVLNHYDIKEEPNYFDIEDFNDNPLSYSQTDDVIYISSDDDTDDIKESFDHSFGPLPNLNEEEENKNDLAYLNGLQIIENDKTESISPCYEDKISFNDDLFINKRKTSVSEDECDSLTNNNEEWWPILSQDFFSDEIPDKDEAASSNDISRINKEKDLDNVIKKIRKARTIKSILTTPQISPKKKLQKKQVDSLDHKNKKQSKKKDKNNLELKKESPKKTEIKKISKRKAKKHGILRKNIMKTHNLEAYKLIAKIEKKNHHLVSKIPSNKIENEVDNTEKINKKKIEKVKVKTGEVKRIPGENISIKVKTDAAGNSKTKKGIAKMSKVSRSQKLTEVNLFGSPPKPIKSERLIKYRIPKKGQKDTNKENNGPVNLLEPTSLTIIEMKKQPEKTYGTHSKNDDSEKENCELKGILKFREKDPTLPRYKVNFPTRGEDFCKVILISPKAKIKRNFMGPQCVKEKETFVIKKPQTTVISKQQTNLIIQPNTTLIIEHPMEFIYTICNWNYDWLFTYNDARKNSSKPPQPPKLYGSTMLPTLTLYNSYNDYKKVFANLMYYEVWESLYRDWERYLSNNMWFLGQIDVVQEQVIKSYLKFLTLKIIVPIKREWSQQGKHPTQGSLISMKHKLNNKTSHVFGYVQGIQKKHGPKYIPHELKNGCRNNEDTVLVLEIFFSKAHLAYIIKSGMTISLSNVSYIKPSLRAFEALCCLKNSVLYSFIMNPGDLRLYEPYGNYKNYIIDEIPLNKVQKEAVIKVSDKCASHTEEPRISLIHGPPGTGKTRVIVALICQINRIFKENKYRNRRILLCAPSNAAVDELAFRLMKLKEINIHLNIVRIGVNHSIHQNVKECSLENKTQREYDKAMSLTRNASVELELKLKQRYYDQANEDYQKACNENKNIFEIDRLYHRKTELMNAREELIKSTMHDRTPEERAQLYNTIREKVIFQAEVICCTLTSCLSGAIYDICTNPKVQFACCIVDEAGQCKETDTWMPLQLGIKKLILVGDHLQLPATVLSYVAHGKNLHQSLFERTYHHISYELNMPNLIHSLKEQYRMHHEICSWPSKNFYHSNLITPAEVTLERNCHLKPYIIFNIEDGKEESINQGAIFNKAEIESVASIINSIQGHLHRFSVGVITPYQQQKHLLIEKLKSYRERFNITVSTVDNFQGQEKDIIICSFVRANLSSRLGFVSDKQRLNVSLTRAKRCLYIVGNLELLKSNDVWKSLIDDAFQRNLICDVNSTNISKNPKLLYDLISK